MENNKKIYTYVKLRQKIERIIQKYNYNFYTIYTAIFHSIPEKPMTIS